MTAAWALGSTEIRLGQSIAALQDLSARGVDSCKPAHVEAMRQAALLTGPIKQVMLIAPNGDTLCTDTSGLAARQEVLTSAVTAMPDIMLDGDEAARLAASAFCASAKSASRTSRVSPRWSRRTCCFRKPRHRAGALGTTRIAMADGTPLGDSGMTAGPGNTGGAIFRQPAVEAISAGHDRLDAAARAWLPTMTTSAASAIVITGGIALVILLFALLLTKREPPDPNAEMARAIRDDEFVPYYQPVVDLQSGRLLGAEVLVRWRAPDGSHDRAGRFRFAFGIERAGAGVYAEADASCAQGIGRRGRTASVYVYRLQRRAAAFRRCADPPRRCHHI